MHLVRGPLAALSCALVLSLAAPVLTSPATGAPVGTVVATAAKHSGKHAEKSWGSKHAGSKDTGSKDTGSKANFVAQEGPTFNSPIGDSATKRAIFDKILRMIRHTRPSGHIKIMTWNFLTSEGATALIGAAKKGVVVRLLMDANNSDADTPNQPFTRLRNSLRAISKGKKWSEKSVAKTCSHSCRGYGGAAHSKYYLFDKVGKSRNVLMQGGANFTVAAAANQWNEIYTYVGRDGIYDFTEGIFDEAWKDKKAKSPYREFQSGRYGLIMSPYYGSDFTEDPVQAALDRVRCTGADKAGNANGHTIIRSAPDVIRGKRGMLAAKRFKKLWDKGCDVHILYTVMGRDVKKVLTSGSGRGPVPMRHLVQDFNGDGDFDNYFHLKVLTINGKLGSDPNTYLTFNGSSNTSDGSSKSDENIGTFVGKGILRKYQRFLDKWFDNPPPGSASNRRATDAPLSDDPYKYVDMD